MGLPIDGFGMYEQTNVGNGQSSWGPNLTQLAQMGMKVVIADHAPAGHIGDLTNYINFAAGLGMKVIIGLADPAIWRDNTYSTKYASMYADSGNAATGTLFAQYIVGQVKNLSGLYGYYVGDEPAAADHTTFASYSSAIHTTDSSKPRVIVQNGAASNSVASGTNTYFDSCEILGDDFYPFQNPNPPPRTIEQEAQLTQSFCTSHGLQSILVLQAEQLSNFGIVSASYPPLSEIENKLDGVCRNSHPQLIIWFSYNQTLISDTPQINIANITFAIAREIRLMAASVLLVQSGTNNGTVTPATPGSLTTTAGNQLFLIVVILGSSSPSISTPGGWTLVDSNNSGTTMFCAVFTQASAGGATNPSVTLNGTVTGWIAIMIEYSGMTGLAKVASAHPNVGTNPVPNPFVNQINQMLQANSFFLVTLVRAGNVTYTPVLTGPQWSSSINSQVNVQGLAIDTFWAGNTGPSPNFAVVGGSLSVSEAMICIGAYYSIAGITYPFSYDNVSGSEGVYVPSFNQGMIGG